MKIAVLRYELGKNRSKNYKVRPGQSVLIGSSNSADIKLRNTEGVDPQHCEVTFDQGTFAIKNLSRKKQSIAVNGSMIDAMNLQNRDRIEIGNNQLIVVIESGPQATPDLTTEPFSKVPAAAVDHASPRENEGAEPTTAEPEVAGETGDSEPVFESYPNGVRAFEFGPGSSPGLQQDVLPMIAGRQEHWCFGVFYNHLLSGLENGRPTEGNLLEGMPGEITQSNDLYFLAGDDDAAILKKFDQYADQGAAVLCVMKKQPQPIDHSQEFDGLVPWFINPETLRFNIINGSDLLVSKVFGLVEALICRNPKTQSDLILLNDISITDWNSFESWIKGAQA